MAYVLCMTRRRGVRGKIYQGLLEHVLWYAWRTSTTTRLSGGVWTPCECVEWQCSRALKNYSRLRVFQSIEEFLEIVSSSSGHELGLWSDQMNWLQKGNELNLLRAEQSMNTMSINLNKYSRRPKNWKWVIITRPLALDEKVASCSNWTPSIWTIESKSLVDA